MVTNMPKQYPDISDILALKTAGRRQRAALSFAEKLDILDALRERVRPLVLARKARQAEQGNGRARHSNEASQIGPSWPAAANQSENIP
jgi:hypothetical protein